MITAFRPIGSNGSGTGSANWWRILYQPLRSTECAPASWRPVSAENILLRCLLEKIIKCSAVIRINASNGVRLAPATPSNHAIACACACTDQHQLTVSIVNRFNQTAYVIFHGMIVTQPEFAITRRNAMQSNCFMSLKLFCSIIRSSRIKPINLNYSIKRFDQTRFKYRIIPLWMQI